MLLHEAYIHVQQRLQNISAFVYKDARPSELDYFWKGGTYMFIKLALPEIDSSIPDKKYSSIQTSLDDLRAITVSNAVINNLTESTFGGHTYVSGSLPVNYMHLLNDRAIVQPIDCTTDGFIEVPNRLTKAETLFNVLDNSIHRTTVNSPVSKISGNVITVYISYKGKKYFNVDNLYIDYLRTPTTYTYATDSGTTLEFPDNVCFKIIDTVVIYMSIIAEQNPQKIQFLASQPK